MFYSANKYAVCLSIGVGIGKILLIFTKDKCIVYEVVYTGFIWPKGKIIYCTRFSIQIQFVYP